MAFFLGLYTRSISVNCVLFTYPRLSTCILLINTKITIVLLVFVYSFVCMNLKILKILALDYIKPNNKQFDCLVGLVANIQRLQNLSFWVLISSGNSIVIGFSRKDSISEWIITIIVARQTKVFNVLRVLYTY